MTIAKSVELLPPVFPLSILVDFIHRWMSPYNDSLEDSRQGILDALEGRPASGGFVVCAVLDNRPAGALVMLRTGMSGYIPPNLLLFVAVDSSLRGKGIGTALIEKALNSTEGAIKLHVETDNPARRLYERIGFSPSYIDMRFCRSDRSRHE